MVDVCGLGRERATGRVCVPVAEVTRWVRLGVEVLETLYSIVCVGVQPCASKQGVAHGRKDGGECTNEHSCANCVSMVRLRFTLCVAFSPSWQSAHDDGLANRGTLHDAVATH